MFAFTLSVFTVFSQSKTFELFRVSTIKLEYTVASSEKDTIYSNLMYLVSYDFDNLVVSFDNASNTKLYISAVISKSTTKNAQGDEYNEMKYFCHDQNNSGCHFTLAVCTSTSDVKMVLEYSDLRITLTAKLLVKPTNTPLPTPKSTGGDNNNNTTISIIHLCRKERVL